MKRKWLIFICVALLFSCSNDKEKRITIWHSLRPQEIEILKAQLQRFAQLHPEWEFTELFYAPETARTNYIISALGGSGPALFWGAADNIGPLVELKVIQPIETLVDTAFLANFITEPVAANQYFQGHIYQIADRVGNHLCLAYNKALIQEPPRTISELIEMGKKLTQDTNGDGKPDRYALAWNYTEPFFAVPFIGGYGGWIIDADNRPTLNTPAVERAAQLIYDLANKHKVIPMECDYEIANALFKDGLSAMIINGAWAWATYLQNGIDLGLTRIPLIDETGLWPSPAISSLGYSVNVNLTGEKLKITIELLKFLTSPEVEAIFVRQSGIIPSRKEIYYSEVVKNNELVRQGIYQLEVGKLLPMVTELRWIWDAMRPSYQGIFTGRVSPAQAAQSMQLTAEKLIKENRE